MDRTVYVIPPRPPIRAFAVAAVAALLGAVLLVSSLTWQFPVGLVVVGAVLLGLGVLLVLLAYLSMSWLAVRVQLDDEGYRVTGSPREHSGTWADVSKVTRSEEGSHVTIYHGNVRRTHLLFPAGDSPLVGQVLDDVLARLQASRRG